MAFWEIQFYRWILPEGHFWYSGDIGVISYHTHTGLNRCFQHHLFTKKNIIAYLIIYETDRFTMILIISLTVIGVLIMQVMILKLHRRMIERELRQV
jgi:hypothetical protein